MKPDTSTARILVVDDEPVLRLMLVRALAEAGYQAEAVGDASTAWDTVREADSPYSLLVTDSAMPGMQGWELARRLRSAFPELPILRTSGSNGRGDRFPAGIPVILKPFGIDAFLQQVRSMLPPPV